MHSWQFSLHKWEPFCKKGAAPFLPPFDKWDIFYKNRLVLTKIKHCNQRATDLHVTYKFFWRYIDVWKKKWKNIGSYFPLKPKLKKVIK